MNIFKKTILATALLTTSLGLSANFSIDQVLYGAEISCTLNGKQLKTVSFYGVPEKTVSGDYQLYDGEYRVTVQNYRHQGDFFKVAIDFDLSEDFKPVLSITSDASTEYAEGSASESLTLEGNTISCDAKPVRQVLPERTFKYYNTEVNTFL